MSMSMRYPEVTISSLTETGQEESSIIVPKQRAYSGRIPVISSNLADIPCATLGVQGILDVLNITLNTSYSLDKPSLSSLLEDCIAHEYDFGMAYGHLRRIWYTNNWSTILDELHRLEEEDQERRQKAITDNRIVDPSLPPRRVWDLYSNRVVTYWIINMDSKLEYSPWPQPISHAWMDEKDRTDVWTPINGCEWPVPIPKDADLNLIRIEMLNLGAEYAWLDVLCLRQVGGWREFLRRDEWKLDVTTIGAVYRDRDVVCYLSGLGRPLTLKEGDLESDRSWFRRAWTLQEAGKERVVAGDTPDGPLHAEAKDGKYETELLNRFHKQLQSTRYMAFDVRELLGEMRKRVSTNPVDRIAGLVFMMGSKWIPAYYESASLEDAWTALVNSISRKGRAQLFFLCPGPGDRGPKWRPSWNQLMTKPLSTHRVPPAPISIAQRECTGGRAEEVCGAYSIEGFVQGMAIVDAVEGDRHGELIVEDWFGTERRFKITAPHMYPIPEDFYTLIHTYYLEHKYSLGHGWVVGRRLLGERFEKVATLDISTKEYNILETLGIIKRHLYILI